MATEPAANPPVPHWGPSGNWEAIDESTGERAPWPAGLEPASLPRPRYRLRDRVTFTWRGRRRTGEVRDIRLVARAQGAAGRPELEYVVYTSGHGYWVPEDQLD